MSNCEAATITHALMTYMLDYQNTLCVELPLKKTSLKCQPVHNFAAQFLTSKLCLFYYLFIGSQDVSDPGSMP